MRPGRRSDRRAGRAYVRYRIRGIPGSARQTEAPAAWAGWGSSYRSCVRCPDFWRDRLQLRAVDRRVGIGYGMPSIMRARVRRLIDQALIGRLLNTPAVVPDIRHHAGVGRVPVGLMKLAVDFGLP